MPPTAVRLGICLDEIVAHAVERIGQQLAAGGLLEDFTEVVSGERARRRPDPPYLWITIGAATAEQSRAKHERWEAALLCNAFVYSEDPEEGWMDAMVGAANARSTVLTDRTFTGLDYVEDSQSVELGPLGHFRAGNRFGAYARINVRFGIAEPPLPSQVTETVEENV